MAELGAYALISSLMNLVSNLLPEVKNILFTPSTSSSAPATDACAVQADLRRLERMLQRIKATLHDAEERDLGDRSVRLWPKEIRELGHEAEYVLEEYMYEVYHAQIEARNASDLNPIKGDLDMNGVYSIKIPYDMVDRIRNIKNRFEEIAKDREALWLPEEYAPRRKTKRHDPTPTSPVVVEQSVFGREKEKKKVIDSLFLEGDGISVLPIVGKGGIGKTTLAQLVYNDKRIVNDLFHMKGWVYVSDDFKIERIARDIIESLTREAYDIKNPGVLMEDFVNIIRGKKIFLVLDDVWNEEPWLWESLRMHLMLATKATILVTTRYISVARIMQTMDPLKLAYLSDDKCWLLFAHYAFRDIIDPANDAKMVEIGKKIVEKCGGLPLAVKTIASLLSHEVELKSWEEVLQSDLWELDHTNGMLAPLQISYEHLPTYLKPCLLLCSMFPKDHEYSMNLMSRLWIAHGYIEPKGRKSIEEVAADYTKELYERSFFDDYNIKCDDYGIIHDATFRLHDMVYNLAWLNSGKTCCAFEPGMLPFISKEVCHFHLNELRGLPKFLRSVNILDMQTLVMNYSQRSFYIKGEEQQINLNCLSKAEHLRALHISYTKDVLPFSLGNLKHLRYLALGHEQLVAHILPESIFSCYNLRVLVLDIENIHIKLERIGNLINLEFLQLFTTSLNLPESLGSLKKLRALEIHRDEGYSRCYRTLFNDGNFLLPECIGNLAQLERIVITGLSLQKLPESICKLTNLKKLILPNCCLKGLPEHFGNLTNLEFLFFKKLHYLPLSCTKLIPSCTMNVCNLRMQPDNCHGAVGWLKECNDLKGALMIKDIQNIMSIGDAKNANLISKHNLETLSLLWDKKDYQKSIWFERAYEKPGQEFNLSEWQFPQDYSTKKGILGIKIGYSKNCRILKDKDLDILENFQPHPNLKHLDICSYRGLEFPRWMGDPLSCSSLVKLRIRSCNHISSLPLSKVLSLKHLYIADCDKLLYLKKESLPSQLEHLTIHECNSLVEVAFLESLTEFEVSTCKLLKSLSTTYLKMPVTASESSEPAREYCHLKSSMKLESFFSLKKMTIRECPNLVIGTSQLLLAEQCEVHIYNCTKVKDWCFQHNFKYDSDEGLMRVPSRKRQFCFEQHQMEFWDSEEELRQQVSAEQHQMEFKDSKEDLRQQVSAEQHQMEFRDSKEELRQQVSAVWNSGQNSDQDSASTANSSLMNLAALYQPPFALMYNGPFEKAMSEAAVHQKWLLVNIQSTDEFSSHMLNRDTWANETLSQIIRSNFLFWQVYNTMTEGMSLCELYNLITLPAILVINPITCQKMCTWTGMVEPDCLLEDLLPYLDKGPQDNHAV